MNFPLKNSRELTQTCSAGVLSAFGLLEDNIFSIRHSTGEFLIECLIVITAIHCVATFTDCYTSQHVTYDAKLAEGQATDSRSSRR